MAENANVTYQVDGQVDLSAAEPDPDIPLKVAAVHDGEILASATLKLPKTGKASFKLAVALPLPCGFRLLLGRADVPNRVFLAGELASTVVPPGAAARTRGARSAAAGAISVSTTLVASAERYRIWLQCCRKYRVQGRVVCRHWRWDGHSFLICDDPVPAATVELFDVDCMWWFCHSDLITSTLTNPDGTFEVEFWWCCVPWRPWPPIAWRVDPDLLDRIRKLIEPVRVRLPFPIPDPPPDLRELGGYLETLSGALRAPAMQPQPEALGATASMPLSETELVRLLPAAPELERLHVWPWWPQSDCAPDLLFRVTQFCGGSTQVIHSETIAQTRWNIPTSLDVTLIANEKACCIPVCEDPPCGDCFKWSIVGCTPVSDIGGNDPLAPVAAALRGLARPGVRDIAFARNLRVFGLFGSAADVDYYEIEYSRDGSPFAPLPLSVLAGFQREYWGPPCGGGTPQFNHPSFLVKTMQDTSSNDHFVYETREHFERDCDPASWGNISFPGGGRFWTVNRDLALVWHTADLSLRTATEEMTETPLLADGLYELRVRGWKDDGSGKLIDPRIMPRCDTTDEERLIIRLDNRTVVNHAAFSAAHPWGPGFVHVGTRDPDCAFLSLVKNEGRAGELPVEACDIVELADGDTLTVHFSVTVPAADTDRHLGGYWMNVHHGTSAVFNAIAASSGVQGVHPGPTYAEAIAQGEARRWWGGGEFHLVLPGSAFPETCAYLFRLHAYKRVFYGCNPIEWFHDNDAEVSITIKKT